MSHLNEANLVAVLDFLMTKPNLTRAAHSIGGNSKLLFSWLQRSANDDPKTLVSWPSPDSEPIQFVAAVQLARKQYVVEYEHMLRDEIMHGTTRTLVHEGRIMWQEDEALSQMSNQDLEDLGIRDRYLRVDGKRIPSTIREPASAHLKIRAASALMPKVWGDHSHVSIDQHISGGVMVIGAPQRPALAAPEPVQEPEQIEPPEQPGPAPTDEQRRGFRPDGTSVQGTAVSVVPKLGDSAEVIELKRLAAAHLARTDRVTRPSAAVMVGKSSDEPRADPGTTIHPSIKPDEPEPTPEVRATNGARPLPDARPLPPSPRPLPPERPGQKA